MIINIIIRNIMSLEFLQIKTIEIVRRIGKI